MKVRKREREKKRKKERAIGTLSVTMKLSRNTREDINLPFQTFFLSL